MKTSTIAYHPNEFSGKRILVMGGTKGIGEAVVTADYPRDVLEATLAADYCALADQLGE